MTLEEAYLMRKQECLSLQRENRKLKEIIDQLRKGTYVFQALLRLTQNIPYSLQELCTACC